MRFRRWQALILILFLLFQASLSLGSRQEALAAASESPAAATSTAAQAAPGGGLQVGPLRLTPALATVGVGERVDLSVQFQTVDGSHYTIDPSRLSFSVTPDSGLASGGDGRFLSTAPGRYQVEAAFTGGGPAIQPATVTVYGAPAGLAFVAPATPVVGNQPATFRLVVTDAQGLPVTSAAGTATVSAGGTVQTVAIAGGRGEVQVTPAAGAVLTLSGSMTLNGSQLTGEHQVEVAVPRPAALRLTPRERYLSANTGEVAAQVELVVLDQTGRPMTDSTQRTVALQVSGPVDLSTGGQSGTILYSGEPAVVTLWSRRGEIGPIRLTASLDGATSATAELEAVITGRMQALHFTGPEVPVATPGQTVTVRVHTRDRNSLPVPAPGAVQIRFSRPVWAQLPGGAAPAEPTDSLTVEPPPDLSFFDIQVRVESPGPVLIAPGSGLDGDGLWITWKPLDQGFPGFTRTTPLDLSPASAEATIRLKGSAGREVTIEAIPLATGRAGDVKLNGSPGRTTLRTDAAGEAELRVEVLPMVDQTYRLSVVGAGSTAPGTNASLDLRVLRDLPGQVEVTLWSDGVQMHTVPAGAPVQVRARVTGTAGQPLPGREGTLRLTLPSGLADLDMDDDGDTVPAEGATGGFTYDAELEAYVWTLRPIKTGAPHSGPYETVLSLTVADTGPAAPVTGARQLTLRPGAPTGVALTGASGGQLQLRSNQAQPFTLYPVDGYGNPSPLTMEAVLAVETGPGLEMRLTPGGATVSSLKLLQPLSLYLISGQTGSHPLAISGGLSGEWTVVVTDQGDVTASTAGLDRALRGLRAALAQQQQANRFHGEALAAQMSATALHLTAPTTNAELYSLLFQQSSTVQLAQAVLWQQAAGQAVEQALQQVQEGLQQVEEAAANDPCDEIRQMRNELIARYEQLLADLETAREARQQAREAHARAMAAMQAAQTALDLALALDTGFGEALNDATEALDALQQATADLQSADAKVASLVAAAQNVLAQIRELENAFPNCFNDSYLPPALPEEGDDQPPAPTLPDEGVKIPFDPEDNFHLSPPEEVGECGFLAFGELEPAQGVWQDDDIFADKATKQLTRINEKLYHAELDMVTARHTLLWGIRGQRDTISMRGETGYTQQVPVSLRFRAHDAGGLRTLYEKPVGTLALDGPCSTETTGFEFKEDATNGLLPQPFTLPAGPYAIRMELVRTDTNTVVETVVTYGNVRTTVGPDMLFTAAVLTAAAGDADASRTAQPLTAAAGRLAQETGLHVPDYFPIAPNSVLATARDSFHDLREPFVRVIEATLDEPDLGKVLDAIREQALVAELNALYVGSAWLGGFDRVVVVLRKNDFTLSGMDGAVAFAPSQKVVFVLPTGNHWDVAHEVVHTLPHLWSEEEMAAACGVNYHNWGRFGNGHRIILGGAENRERKERYPGLMGPATREADYWIEQCTYWHLLDQLVAIPDPELLAVRGLLYQGDDGTHLGAFLPSYTLMGEPDLTEGTGGEYALVVTDAAGKRLGRFPFNPRFRYSESEEDVNLISFGYRIPRPAGAAGIELHGPAGVLAREAISPNAPSVTLSAPAAGAEVAPGPKGIAVAWSAADPDGDTLTYALLYSPDGGKRWVDAVPFTTETSASVPVDLLAAGGQHLFRVVASDGFNSTEVTMASPFRLKDEEPGAPALTIRLPIDSPTATVNGRTVTLDAPAMIVENRTLVPLRFVSEALGAEVGWNGETRQITVKLESTTVELWLDQTRARVNGEERTLDVPPLIVNGRSLVPIRFVAEALQAKVEWEPESRTVIITR
ncbi:MAG: stalk domain-containing protein [Bacillota bacterium]